MVEKWLVQVEDLMVKSMRAIALDAVAAYFNSPRSLWVLNWPGMIVLCGSSIHWTAEVSESITKGTLKVFFQKLDFFFFHLNCEILLESSVFSYRATLKRATIK